MKKLISEQDLKNKDIIKLIQAYVKNEIKQDEYNVLNDYYIMIDKNGNVALLLNYLLLSKLRYVNRMFELYSLSIENGTISANKTSRCEILEYRNCRLPKIYINYIGTYEKECVGKGYNYMILRAVEQYALTGEAKRLFGLYLPMLPGDNQTAYKFYLRNNFEHYYDYSGDRPADMIEKMRVDFRNMTFNNVNGIKMSSNVFEKTEEETNINN